MRDKLVVGPVRPLISMITFACWAVYVPRGSGRVREARATGGKQGAMNRYRLESGRDMVVGPVGPLISIVCFTCSLVGCYRVCTERGEKGQAGNYEQVLTEE